MYKRSVDPNASETALKHRRWREANVAKGMCSACGKEPFRPGSIIGEKCAQKSRDSYNKHKEERSLSHKEWRKRDGNVASRTKSNAAWRFTIKREFFDAYGGKCACCGESQTEFLTVDHIDGNGKAHREAMKASGLITTSGTGGGSQFYRGMRKQGYPQDQGLRVLCWNCHRALHDRGFCPHGNV